MKLPKFFRKLSLPERQKALNFEESSLSALADQLIESAIGTFPIPLGAASGFLIDGQEYIIPMATEEPSVIAGASYAASLIKSGGGFKTESTPAIMTAQIFITHPSFSAKKTILLNEERIRTFVNQQIPGMVARGGGYHSLHVSHNEATLAVSIDIDVQDSMGANTLNTVAEKLKPLLTELSEGEVLMSILTNSAAKRRAKATFQMPERYLSKETCHKIVQANQLAQMYPERAITHNKGIMNGISALALATGNDTRAIEAAAHFSALKEGRYQPLTTYTYEKGQLMGSLEMALPIATVGGSINIWPIAQYSLKLMGNPSARQLTQIAVSLGLAQNLAALLALVTKGIQHGHMQLHAKKYESTR